MKHLTLIEFLFFFLLPNGTLICALMYAWGEVRRREDELVYLKEKTRRLTHEVSEY